MQRLVIEPEQQKNGKVFLTPSQSHYLYRVLRLKAGDRFLSLDRQGKTWLSQLLDGEALLLEPVEENHELPCQVKLLVAIPKGNGFEDIVRCCTEIGVTELVPLLSERTLVQPSPQKLERWRKIAQEAAEQSERQVIPQVSPPQALEKALEKVDNSRANCYICVTRREAKSLLWYLQQQPLGEIVIMTGPEGGWTEAEIVKAIAHNFQPVSLGGRILRAVTAPVMAMALVAATLEL